MTEPAEREVAELPEWAMQRARDLCFELSLAGDNREPLSRDVKTIAAALTSARAEGWRMLRARVSEAMGALPSEPPEDEQT